MQYLVLLDKTFALTGKFSVGHRKKCIQHIRDYGGIYHPNVTTKTAYLIVGQYSPTSKSATNKLKYAIKLQQNDNGLQIIHEQEWLKTMFNTQADIIGQWQQDLFGNNRLVNEWVL